MGTKPDELDRRLGRTEHVYWLLDQLYCLNFAAIVELEGRLNVADVQAALDIVQRENPTLRASITTDRIGRPCFTSVAADEYPLILEVHGLRNWRQAIETQLMTAFEKGDAPLARFLLFRGTGKKSVVAMIFHHSIADGKSGVCALLDVLRRVVGQDLRAALGSPHFKKAQPSSQQLDLIQNKGPVAGKLKELKFWLGMGKEILKFPEQLPGYDMTPGDARKIKILPFSISPKTSASLLSACRDNDTTVHGALGAALLFALSEEFKETKSRYLALNSLVDLRGSLEGELTDQDLGLYISTLTTVHQLDEQPDFWRLAREIPEYLKKIISSGDANIINSVYPETPLYTPDRSGARRLQKVVASAPPSSMLTNIGRVNVLPLGSDLHISALSFAVSPPVQHPICMTTASYDGQIYGNVLYDQCKVKETQAKRITKNILGRLQREGAGN
jgi:NRPS condensation-like uncharacterized protein